jgi:hypothetical protein
MDYWSEVRDANRETLRRIIAYCERRGIGIPSAFLKDQLSPGAFRYSVIMVSSASSRLVGRPFESFEQANDWIRTSGGQEPRPIRIEVIDMLEGRLYQGDSAGKCFVPSRMPPIQPISSEELVGRKAAINRSVLASSMQALFGAEGLTPRRLEIIDALAEREVRIQSGGGWDMVRVHLPNGMSGGEELIAELFDPLSKTPLECIEAYPWGLKLGLAYSFYCNLQTPVQRATCRRCQRLPVPECVRPRTEGRCIPCFFESMDGRRISTEPGESEVAAFVAKMESSFRISPNRLAKGWGEVLAQLGREGVYAEAPEGESSDTERLYIHIPKGLEEGAKEIFESFFSGSWHLRFKNSGPDGTFRFAVKRGAESKRPPSSYSGGWRQN